MRLRIGFFIFIGLAVIGTGMGLASALFPAHRAYAAEPESAYDRVIRTNTLRCGYGTWKPGVYQDPKTGQMSGLFVELMNAIGKLNGLSIEWTSEVDWGQISTALKSQKIDAFCAGMAGDAARGKVLGYTLPLSYWAFDVLVRADDKRFPNNGHVSLTDLNKSGLSTAYSEGDVLETIARTEFPNVKGVALPPLGSPADNLMNVVTGKTDFVVFPKVMFLGYNAENPGKIRYLKVDPPLRVYGNVVATDIHEAALIQLLNAGINELVASGVYQNIMNKYAKSYPGAFLPIEPSYQRPH